MNTLRQMFPPNMAPRLQTGQLKQQAAESWQRLAKITGTLEYLDSVSNPNTPDEDRLEENDIVVLTDSYDVWFQLPPEILLKRYHEANGQANQRLASQWNGRGKPPMEQSIIISAQKKCFPPPSSGSVLHCDQLPGRLEAQPERTSTDQKPTEALKCFTTFRRVHERMQRGLVNGRDLYSDQGMFGEIFAEQEIWRRWLRKNTVSRKDKNFDVMLSDFEYHVGLDYTQNLFIPTVFEEQDGEIIALSNETGIAEKSVSLGIEPRLDGVPDDIQSSSNPLNMHVLHDPADWGDMPVYADFYSTAIPVVVHHNAHKDGAKNRRYLWWDRIWFFPYLRQLIKSQAAIVEAEPLLEIAVNGKRLVYWESRSNTTQKKPKTFVVESGEVSIVEREFGYVCRAKTEKAEVEKPWYDEVFRDGHGEL
ncbi:uncharacterized protein FSUBG_10225 [Fusarium subglutinans]|uniref:Uncharacterized protein n=1 Tax=Gibberella subglutinans TaxID=42677 RepID=A0A8H5P8W5_GIBSU|nr:uncharacterized protein FSUBG_10225 [Fusarium subglutinans]KAF5592184.1 hypothetical protein FSUBG_10225 [Fusarium subglutinans]